MIGPSIIIKGEVSGGEDLHIQGRVEGTINLTGNQVSVGESGQVCADIQAKHVKIDGEVTGDVSASENVVISKSGNVRGNIVAPRVTLEDGANFKGSIDMDPSAAASGAAPLSSRQPANSPAPDIKTPALDLKSALPAACSPPGQRLEHYEYCIWINPRYKRPSYCPLSSSTSRKSSA